MSVTFVVVSVVLLCFRPIFPFSSFQPFLFIEGFDSSALCRSRRELSNEYVRYCYSLLFKFSFFSLSSCPLFSIFFSNQIAIQTHICLQKLASIQPRTSPLKFAASRGDEVLTPEESCAAKCALQPKRLNLLGIKVRPLASSRMEVPPTMIDRAN